MRFVLVVAGIVLLALAGAATATVHAVHTDRSQYTLSDTVTIRVIADDGDTVSVQVTKKIGAKRQPVWNSSAKTIPMDSADGSTGYVVFSWDISSYNEGRGAYLIQVFIGGDPSTGVPTPVDTFVLVVGANPTMKGQQEAGSLQSVEDAIALGTLTEEQEDAINRALGGEQNTTPEVQPGTQPSPAEPPAEVGGISNATEAPALPQTPTPEEQKVPEQPAPAITQRETPESAPLGIISVVIDSIRSLFRL